MITKLSLTKLQSTLLIVLSIIIVALLLMLAESYFNLQEIDLLVNDAIDRNLDYELIIHNPYTNSYSFRVLE